MVAHAPKQNRKTSLNRTHLRNVVSFGPFLVWIVFVALLSISSMERVPRNGLMGIPHFDKIAHFGVYFIMAVLGMLSIWRRERQLSVRNTVIIGVVCVSIGVILEIAQFYGSKTRHFEVFDIIANIIGTLSGCIVFNAFIKRIYYGS